MGLRGWRLFGVAGTIFVYVAGILFLSLMNMPGPHPKKTRLSRFGEMNAIHSPELTGLSRRQPIQWCKELSFVNITAFNSTPTYSKEKSEHSRIEYENVNYKQHKIKASQNHGISKNVSTVNNVVAVSDKSAQELTALASFPGSGNTWLRYLLQQSTGFLTGSIYKDYGLLKSGFPAENICNKSVLVVKTHEWGPNAWGQFKKAILLVRDPDKSILAEFNRQSGGHVGFASADRYKRTKGRYWQQFVNNKLNGWENMNLAWARNFTGSIKILYYDDLVADVEGKLREVLNFLNFTINEELLSCALSRKEGIYRRRKRPLAFDPYSSTMRQLIDERKIKVYNLLGRRLT